MNGGGMARGTTLAGCLALLFLGACNNVTVPDNPRLSGSRGGKLPGMTSATAKNTAATAAGVPLLQDQHQTMPDGRTRTVATLGGVRYQEILRNRQGEVERVIWYADGVWPRSIADYGPGGVRIRETFIFPGTTQLERTVEYNPRGDVASFVTYWPGGKMRLRSQDGVETPAGPVYRVQEWYQDGQVKSIEQYEHIPERNYRPRRQGRQTSWNEDGQVVYDVEYSHGTLVRDYLTPPEPKNAPR